MEVKIAKESSASGVEVLPREIGLSSRPLSQTMLRVMQNSPARDILRETGLTGLEDAAKVGNKDAPRLLETYNRSQQQSIYKRASRE